MCTLPAYIDIETEAWSIRVSKSGTIVTWRDPQVKAVAVVRDDAADLTTGPSH